MSTHASRVRSLINSLCGDQIGFTLSRATTLEIPCALFSGDSEINAREEEIVVIRDSHEGVPLILGILRRIRRLEPFLRPEQRVTLIEFPDEVERIETMHYTNAVVIPLAEIHITSGGVRLQKVVRYVPFPKSTIHRLRSGHALTNLLRQLLGNIEPLIVGHHIFTSDLEIPLDPRYICYHIGVFGATGTGKSRLVMALANEIIQKTDYAVIIFDHTGLDYADKAFGLPSTCIIRSLQIIPSPDALSSWFIRRLRVSDQVAPYVEATVFRWYHCTNQASEISVNFESDQDALQRIQAVWNQIRNGRIRPRLTQIQNWEQQLAQLIAMIRQALMQYPSLWSSRDLRECVRQVFRELLVSTALDLGAQRAQITLAMRFDQFIPSDLLLSMLFRIYTPAEILDEAFRAKSTHTAPLIIDLSYDFDIETKRSIVASVIDATWERVFQTRREISMIFVIDEAQNYASRNAGYCKDAVESIAREGRKWGLGLIIVSQRLVGSIDTDIRANLNTLFFSRLSQLSDVKEVANYADVAGIGKENLAQLDEREFFIAGLMNPIRKAIAIHVRNVSGWIVRQSQQGS